MIWALIVIWVIATTTFFGSLAFVASRSLPSFDAAADYLEPELTTWQSPDHAPALTASQAAVS